MHYSWHQIHNPTARQVDDAKQIITQAISLKHDGTDRTDGTHRSFHKFRLRVLCNTGNRGEQKPPRLMMQNMALCK